MEKTVVSTQVDAPIRVRLEQLAAEAGRTLSAEIRRAIRSHLSVADEAMVSNGGENDSHDITEE